MSLFAEPAFAQDPLGIAPAGPVAPAQPRAAPVVFGRHEVTLAAPPGTCLLDYAYPQDLQLLTNADIGQGGQNVVLVVYAPCADLAQLRGGEITRLGRTWQVFTPTRLLDQSLIGPGFSRAEVLKPLAEGWRDTKLVTEGVETGATAMSPLGRISMQDWLGVLAESPDYVVTGLVQKLELPGGGGFASLTVTGATVLEGAVITVTVTDPVAAGQDPRFGVGEVQTAMVSYLSTLISLNDVPLMPTAGP